MLLYRLKLLPCVIVNYSIFLVSISLLGMGPLRQEQEEQEEQHEQQEVLLLDTTVDSTVDFTAQSVLPQVTRRPGKTATRIANTSSSSTRSSSSTLPVVPVAGSKGWLPSMVDVGRKEVRARTYGALVYAMITYHCCCSASLERYSYDMTPLL